MGDVRFAGWLGVGLFLGMLVMLEIGRRVGDRVERLDPEGAHTGTGPVEGAVFALLGLLVAFSFSGAAARFDARRHLIVEETNAIGTAYLRLDLAPAAAQPALRDLFRRYLDTRLEVYRLVPDLDAVREALGRAERLQGEIWSASLAACRDAGSQPCAILLLPALNAMIDITTTRTAAGRMHPPWIIVWLLCGLGLGCALLAGYSMATGERRKWTHILAFAAVMALTVFVILDLEFPRIGFIRVDEFDRLLLDLRAGMDR
ncbi:MAG: DUF4239 domain-containing protein [Deltaproteobacteria bacterium]|nr:DUF4239 domain-containing protein [Deltaproteobacteria bacterium]